jgi:hypothetical protein
MAEAVDAITRGTGYNAPCSRFKAQSMMGIKSFGLSVFSFELSTKERSN